MPPMQQEVVPLQSAFVLQACPMGMLSSCAYTMKIRDLMQSLFIVFLNVQNYYYKQC
jgi:hypothetical protein